MDKFKGLHPDARTFIDDFIEEMTKQDMGRIIIPPDSKKKLDEGQKIVFGDSDGVYLICNLAHYKELLDEINKSTREGGAGSGSSVA